MTPLQLVAYSSSRRRCFFITKLILPLVVAVFFFLVYMLRTYVPVGPGHFPSPPIPGGGGGGDDDDGGMGNNAQPTTNDAQPMLYFVFRAISVYVGGSMLVFFIASIRLGVSSSSALWWGDGIIRFYCLLVSPALVAATLSVSELWLGVLPSLQACLCLC